MPIAAAVMVGDSLIEGIGNSPDAVITVELPDDNRIQTTTGSDRSWKVNIPGGAELSENDEIKVIQKEPGKQVSDTFIQTVNADRPIDIYSEMETENLIDRESEKILSGDTLKYSVTISNFGDDEEYADRLQLTGVLPKGLTLVGSSVRYIVESDDGNESVTRPAKNTLSVISRGYSFNASTRRLEIRLGNHNLYGGDMVTVEFEVTLDANAQGGTIESSPFEITAHRVSKSSKWNNAITMAVVE
jgi:uncharacterized repeat protein (TIGR01451 family)